MRMTSLANRGDFSLKIWGSYRVYLYAEPERFDAMIIWESMRIRRELNTNWYDAVRCNNMQHDGDTMQYEAVRWWWRINTIALWCDENTIGTNRNLHEPMRTCAIQYDNAIVARVLQRTESQRTGGESQCECTTNRYECTTMRYEPKGTDTNWYGFRLCNTNRLRFEGPIRMFWSFQNIRIGLRTNTKMAAN